MRWLLGQGNFPSRREFFPARQGVGPDIDTRNPLANMRLIGTFEHIAIGTGIAYSRQWVAEVLISRNRTFSSGSFDSHEDSRSTG